MSNEKAAVRCPFCAHPNSPWRRACSRCGKATGVGGRATPPKPVKPPPKVVAEADAWKLLDAFRQDPAVGAGIVAVLGASRALYQAVFGARASEKFAEDLGAVVNDDRTRAGEIAKVLVVITGGLAGVVWLALRA